ncbi:MAG: hypothetical protein EBR82_19085 [Caulobacteraceae bacterium]|nr:hypothetical protein [Caulobacteraceae bacterium]
MKNIFALLAALLITAFSARAESAPTPPAPAAAPSATAAGLPAAPAPDAPAPAPVQAEAPARKRKEDEITAAGTTGSPGLLDRVKAFLSSNKNIADLHAQISALTGERNDARTQLAALQAQITALTTERNAALADIANVTALLDGQRNIVQATAAEIANTVGQPLAALPAPLAEEATEKPKATDAEFRAMDSTAREQFFAKGGKIVG